jgi:hypothetical protein
MWKCFIKFPRGCHLVRPSILAASFCMKISLLMTCLSERISEEEDKTAEMASIARATSWRVDSLAFSHILVSIGYRASSFIH